MSEPRSHLEDSDIGRWVVREAGTRRRLTKAHYVQSVIAGGAVTYCGRVLHASPLTRFLTMDVPVDKCATCGQMPTFAYSVGAGEDDGSTHAEVAP